MCSSMTALSPVLSPSSILPSPLYVLLGVYSYKEKFVALLKKCCYLFYFWRRLRKIAKNDHWLRRVCPSVHREQLCCHRTDFHGICIWVFFENRSIKLKFHWTLAGITTTLRDICTFVIISRWILLRMRNVSDKSCRQKKKLFSVTVFRNSCRLWDNVEKYDTASDATDDNMIRCMRFACWITKATDTRSEYVILNCFSTATVVTRTPLYVTFIHTLCVLFNPLKTKRICFI
jgi:hypothetical protein